MQLTLAEFIKSQTATRKGLDNTPGPEHLANAKELFENVVQKVRENFGVTVINSGYRGPGTERQQLAEVQTLNTAKVKR